jgi:hypothetical protein
MITIAIGMIGTITIGMIGTTMIETTGTIETNEFFIYSGPEKNWNKDGGDQGKVGSSLSSFNCSGACQMRTPPIGYRV